MGGFFGGSKPSAPAPKPKVIAPPPPTTIEQGETRDTAKVDVARRNRRRGGIKASSAS